DYNLPQRFDLTYVDADDTRKRPVMIHRAPFGSLERFIGVLIEHTGGRFPLWLAPVQAKVLPLNDDLTPRAREAATALREAGLRVEVDDRSEKLGRKIRDAEVEKVPYMLVLGNKEAEAGALAVRRHAGEGSEDLGAMPVAEVASLLQREVTEQLGRSR